MLYTILITAALIALSHGNIYNWQEKPYGNGDFNTRSEFGHNVTLECNDTRVSQGFTFKYWIRPDLEIMVSGDADIFNTPIDGPAGWIVDLYTNAMFIFNVHGDHFGFYYCVVDNGGQDMIIKKGLNYQGPYFGDLWPEYEMNVIVGCSAAGGLIVIIIVIYLVDKFYYDPKQDNRSDSGSFDLSAPGSSSMSDESQDMKKQNGIDISVLEPGLDNEIQNIMAYQQASSTF